MGEDIQTTGIQPGSVTDGDISLERAIELLCGVVDGEVVPGIRSLCRHSHKHENILLDPKNGAIVRIATLEERSRWTKAILFLGLGSIITAIFTLIVAVVLPAIGG